MWKMRNGVQALPGRVGRDNYPGAPGVQENDVDGRRPRGIDAPRWTRPACSKESAIDLKLSRDAGRGRKPRRSSTSSVDERPARADARIERNGAGAMRDRTPDHRRQLRVGRRIDPHIDAF